MAQTKLVNLIDPEVMAEMVSAELPAKIKFLPLAIVDDTLKERAGSTISTSKFNYIGDATVVAEGQPIDLTLLTADATTVTVKKVAKGAEVTDEAVLSGYGDPVNEIKNQLVTSIASKIDAEIIALLGTSVLSFSATAMDVDNIASGLDLFDDEDEEAIVLFMNNKDAQVLRKTMAGDWVPATDMASNIITTGVYGDVLGAEVVRSKRIPQGTAFLVKQGAIKLFMKKDVEVEEARDIVTKTTIMTADEHFAVSIASDAKVVKIVIP